MADPKYCQFIIKSKDRQCQKLASHRSDEDPRFCHWHQKGATEVADVEAKYFGDDVTLPEKEQKWCRCVLHVASKQTPTCLEDVNKNSGLIFDGKKCYNPYPICSASTKTASRRCGENYNFKGIPDAELIAYAIIKKLPVPEPYVREQMLTVFDQWKKDYVPKTKAKKYR